MALIEKIGAFAGLASFLGLALIAFLQFMQARHVRDLEDKATFVPEGLDLPTSPAPAKKGKTAKVATPGAALPADTAADAEEAEQPVEAQVAQTKEAARQVEIARAAQERRERFERRRRPGAAAPAAVGSGAPMGRRRPEPRSLIVIGLGIAVLAAGVIFAATNLLGGSDKSSTSGGGAAAQAPVTSVAVLNGTPVPALAAKVGQGEVRPAGFKLGFVGNTDIPFTVSTVMFDPSDPANQKTAQAVAARLKITKIEPMSADIKKAIKGEPVAVVVGEDRAGT
jgi:hypothetical protein